MDVTATVSDPLGSLIGAGLGWLMEHLEPLKGWLNDLTGDAGAVLGFAGTWANIATAMDDAGNELNRVVRADLDDMSGASIAAYARYTDELAQQIRATGAAASAISSALTTCSTVVRIVHDLVRDALAQLVGSIVSSKPSRTSSPDSPRPPRPDLQAGTAPTPPRRPAHPRPLRRANRIP